ncbi:hypothetical protein [Paraburkholderia hiiakae]|uniref:hypothetical protein n=1 Tax=Paraburkholderia hiiakae TaxID=1081782 RepID=UPI001918605D|nr:hypothetical protein [Paraburkholderia hiiakae]
MKDDRLRVPVDPTYVAALGLAAYAFAILEWNAVWCCERLEPGCIDRIAERTAGNIAKYFIRLAEANGSAEIISAARRFDALVHRRNGLLHGKPGTDEDGGQRLFRNGVAWTEDDIGTVVDDFTECSLTLNSFLYGALCVAES